MREYRALLRECRALLRECRAFLSECRALLRECGKLIWGFLSKESKAQSISKMRVGTFWPKVISFGEIFDRMSGSFGRIWGSNERKSRLAENIGLF